MTARTKLAVFFMLTALLLPILAVQATKNSALVNLSVNVKETVAVSTKNNQLNIQTNSANAFFVLVHNEDTGQTSYLPATDNLLLETGRTYTVISAP